MLQCDKIPIAEFIDYIITSKKGRLNLTLGKRSINIMATVNNLAIFNNVNDTAIVITGDHMLSAVVKNLYPNDYKSQVSFDKKLAARCMTVNKLAGILAPNKDVITLNNIDGHTITIESHLLYSLNRISVLFKNNTDVKSNVQRIYIPTTSLVDIIDDIFLQLPLLTLSKQFVLFGIMEKISRIKK